MSARARLPGSFMALGLALAWSGCAAIVGIEEAVVDTSEAGAGAHGGGGVQCASHDDCQNTDFCDGHGKCVERLAVGKSCKEELGSAQCQSGHCVDGYCCDGECDGGCGHCDAEGKQGTCLPVADGQPSTGNKCDPYLCDGKVATCASACAGHGDCASGACTAGACTECAPGSKDCAGNVPRTCDQAGAWQSGPACQGAAAFCCTGSCAGGALAVAAGADHTCAVKTDGTLWCWGSNSFGQLGDGTTQDRTSPVQLSALATSALGVAAGWGHTCAVKADGTLWCWGYDEYGQLGDGTTQDKTSPVQVAALGGCQ